MKVILQQEKIEYKCDGCGKSPEWGISGELNICFGYDSSRDGDHGLFHFCADCTSKIWDRINGLYPNLKLNDLDRKW